jgi:hypothetical protein
MDARIASVLESIAGELEKPRSVKLLAAQQWLSRSCFQGCELIAGRDKSVSRKGAKYAKIAKR